MPTPAQAAPQRQGLLGGFFGPEGRDRRQRLALALEGLTMNPNQALIGQIQADIQGREEQRQQNATIEWLRSRGRDDLAQAMMGGLSAAEAMRIAMTPAAGPEIREVGGKLVSVGPNGTVTELYAPTAEPEFRRATPEEAAAYGATAGQFGPDGRFYPVEVPQGMTIESDGQGGFRLVQGPAGVPGAGKPPTEGQLAGAGYLQRMTAAENILRDLERRQGIVAIPVEKTILMDTGIEGYVLNAAEQQVAQAQRDWVRSKLRKEYVPQPGEGPEVVAQKAEARRRAERQMQIGAGTAAEQAGEISQPYAAPIRAEDLSAAGIGTQGGAGSQPVVIDGVTIRKVN
jgi:hypothetical protein